jgi:hypothetical protein
MCQGLNSAISQRYLRQTVAVQLTELGSLDRKIRILFAGVVVACDQVFGISHDPKLKNNFVMKDTDQLNLNRIFFKGCYLLSIITKYYRYVRHLKLRFIKSDNHFTHNFIPRTAN